jgi:hypothetical protein
LIKAQTDASTANAAENAKLNRVNEVTPYGRVDFSQDGGGNWTRTTSESDAQRALREAQERQGQELANLGITQTQRVQDILGKPYTAPTFNSREVTGGAFDPASFGEAPKLDLAGYKPQGMADLSRFAPQGQMDLTGFQPKGEMDLSRYDPTRALGDYGQDVETRTFDLATRGMDRAFGRAEEDLRTRLANQGLTTGGEAFGTEMQDFNVARGDAYARALLGARDTARADRGQKTSELAMGADLTQRQRGQTFAEQQFGADLAQRQREQQMAELGMGANLTLQQRQQMLSEMGFGADLATQEAAFGTDARNRAMADALMARQQNLAEREADYGRQVAGELSNRQVPLSEITSIMGGLPIQPINPGAISTINVAAPDVMGAYGMQQAAQQNAYNQRMAGRNAIIGGLAGLGGAALGGGGIFGKAVSAAGRTT